MPRDDERLRALLSTVGQMFQDVLRQIAIEPLLDKAACPKVVVRRQIVSQDGISDGCGCVPSSKAVDKPYRRLEAAMKLILECRRESMVVHYITVCENRHHHGLNKLPARGCCQHRCEASERPEGVEHLLDHGVDLLFPCHVAVELQSEVCNRVRQSYNLSVEDNFRSRLNSSGLTENDGLCFLRVWVQAVSGGPSGDRFKVVVHVFDQSLDLGYRPGKVDL